MSRTPIAGVFDSGVGGLTVYETVRHRLPGIELHYCFDNQNYPYGIKADDEVIRCAWEAVRGFVAAASLDLLIVACNTASTIALPHLRAGLGIPVVGVVPAIKPAALQTRSGTIALLATPATIKRPYTDQLVQDFASKCNVLRLGTRELVDMAENKLRGQPVSLPALAKELARLFEQSPQALHERLDTVVLGCTHFPLLREELVQVAPWPVNWLDSAPAIAARTKILFEERGLDPAFEAEGSLEATAYCTRMDDAAKALLPALKSLGLTVLKELS